MCIYIYNNGQLENEEGEKVVVQEIQKIMEQREKGRIIRKKTSSLARLHIFGYFFSDRNFFSLVLHIYRLPQSHDHLHVFKVLPLFFSSRIHV